MFQTALLNFNSKVSDLAKQAESGGEESLQELTEYLINGSKALRQAYKKEFTLKLKEKNVLPKIEFIAILVNAQLEKSVKSYFIDDTTGTITIEFKESVPLTAPLTNLNELMEMLFNVTSKDDTFYILLGYFSDTENYQLIQVYNLLT